MFPHEPALFSGHPQIETFLLDSPSYQKLRATTTGADALEVPNEDKEKLSSMATPP
ncbi:hypothetical protein ACD661_00995 [Legionella lytica]|uniref:Uncharacterized protein n=1 Tax=Legionella lytica TaxID=96232 RepID=A0ABW8D362_9GAMM